MTEGVENPTADMNKLIYALQKQQPCHVILTNKTKTNEIFRNYLTIKPIFNTERVCEYILGKYVTVYSLLLRIFIVCYCVSTYDE
jgi:hypothetical protein